MIFKSVSLAGATIIALATPAFAHHSFAMFDGTKTITVSGTLKEFELVNPHSWIHIVAPDPATGEQVDWQFEMGSPGQLGSRGVKADTIKPGDKVTIQMHPMKDGSHGGQYMSAVLADGSMLGGPNRPAGAPANANAGP